MTFDEAMHLLSVLDGDDIPNDALVRTAALVGPDGLHKLLTEALTEKRWVRGYGHVTNRDLRTTPWLSPWSSLVDAQIDRFKYVCTCKLKGDDE